MGELIRLSIVYDIYNKICLSAAAAAVLPRRECVSFVFSAKCAGGISLKNNKIKEIFFEKICYY